MINRIQNKIFNQNNQAKNSLNPSFGSCEILSRPRTNYIRLSPEVLKKGISRQSESTVLKKYFKFFQRLKKRNQRPIVEFNMSLSDGTVIKMINSPNESLSLMLGCSSKLGEYLGIMDFKPTQDSGQIIPRPCTHLKFTNKNMSKKSLMMYDKISKYIQNICEGN